MRKTVSFAVLAFVLSTAMWAAGASRAAPQEGQTFLRVGDATPKKTNTSADCTFVITRSGDLSRTSRVEYDTDSGTAKEGRHFAQATGFLEFAQDETTKTIVVDVLKQKFRHSSFTLRIYNPSSNTNIDDEEGFCVIHKR